MSGVNKKKKKTSGKRQEENRGMRMSMRRRGEMKRRLSGSTFVGGGVCVV